ncbi:MAG: ABC transporter ATP-binding protein [Clostridia bacterium]|nr:ABC transporter ATP-binding protein [Clostridia bacterium]
MIKAVQIEKSYNNEKVLKSIDLTVEEGEFLSIMGESGSGKSTLISILGGFLQPDCGKVFWNGQDISKFSQNQMAEMRCSRVGFVFQSFKLISTLTAKDNILLPVTLGKKYNEQTQKYIDELTKELNLTELLDKYPDQLSGGQCQRVAIVRALAYKPKLVILDEPTGALDSVMEQKVMGVLSRINRELKTTIIQVTHSQNVSKVGSRIIVLKDGQIQQ